MTLFTRPLTVLQIVAQELHYFPAKMLRTMFREEMEERGGAPPDTFSFITGILSARPIAM